MVLLIIFVAYDKISQAWSIYKTVQDTDVSYNGVGKYFYEYGDRDILRPRRGPYPELKRELSIVPLQLQNEARRIIYGDNSIFPFYLLGYGRIYVYELNLRRK